VHITKEKTVRGEGRGIRKVSIMEGKRNCFRKDIPG
jgi:hypothetical protein